VSLLLLLPGLACSIALMVAQLMYTSAGTLLVFENERWLHAAEHQDTYPHTFFEALYLSVMTATSVGYVLQPHPWGVAARSSAPRADLSCAHGSIEPKSSCHLHLVSCYQHLSSTASP
jgi:hypothetical protein